MGKLLILDLKLYFYHIVIIILRFVSRVNVRATDKHVVLGMQQFKPLEFASQIALNMDNAWGIVRCIIDFLNKQTDGKYIIMKDPNKVNYKYNNQLIFT